MDISPFLWDDSSMTERPAFITDLDLSEIETHMAKMGEPRYRAAQLLDWVYKKHAASFEDMTNFPKSLRQKLAAEVKLASVALVRTVASQDGTAKALLELYDGRTIETALMPGTKTAAFTVCVSSQVGCAVSCPFCATGQQGYERNLGASEIVDQVLYFARYLGGKGAVANVVFMGMGEPLANYGDVMGAVMRLNAPWGFGLGARNITISTSGVVPGIQRLSKEKLQIGLAVSLHAANDELRNILVPLNRKYPLASLMAACRDYITLSGRRVTFEYCLFHGVNDSLAQARELAHLIHGMNAHVNLIAANPTAGAKFKPPSRETVLAFEAELGRLGVNATLRRSFGPDIEAGCGQLKSRAMTH
jgi:23S rRNA (adenine2503-C2)-methyltransferase